MEKGGGSNPFHTLSVIKYVASHTWHTAQEQATLNATDNAAVECMTKIKLVGGVEELSKPPASHWGEISRISTQ